MVLEAPRAPLQLRELPDPEPGASQLLVRVRACGICRTDLHIVDGELDQAKLPLVPGHQVVGEVVAVGRGVSRFAPGDRVGIAWLGWACSTCSYCDSGRENLCARARFTGYTLDGGFAELVLAADRFAFPLPDFDDDLHTAPLLCAGMVGFRALRFAGDAERIGLYGFGASAHIVAQVAAWQGRRVFSFTRRGDEESQRFARSLGAVWAGQSNERPPEELDAALIFAPAGELVPTALKAVAPGGTVVCAGIHMSDIPSFRYELLWGERTLRSVANLTRADGEELLAIAPQVPIKTTVHAFPLEQANDALARLRAGTLEGAAVLAVSSHEGSSLDRS
jgi:propanol-preferring alcohol dehydrogenase